MRLIPSLAKSGQVFDPPKLHSGPACDCCRAISSGSSRVVGCRFDCGNLVSISIQLVLRWYLPLSGSFVVAGCGQPVFFNIARDLLVNRTRTRTGNFLNSGNTLVSHPHGMSRYIPCRHSAASELCRILFLQDCSTLMQLFL